ncbi:MAG: autoinducer-2 kinase [Desulfobacteraceae bacterium]|nr:autoinducer-2 kinase [Desulfobacteraceae bacterium]
MDSKQYIMTLDAGSGSGRAVLFDTDGKEVSFAQKEWLPKTIPEYPGSYVFDTTEAWEILGVCIRESLKKGNVDAGDVIGVSATSQREGFVLYDKDGKEIWACPNVDSRAVDEVVEMLEMDIVEKIYGIGGDWLNIIAPPRFRWIKKHEPEIFAQAQHMNMLSDWVLFKLSGRFVTDPSVGSSSGMFNLRKRNWSDEIIDMCELPKGIYPEVFESGTPIGEVTKEAAALTGFREGTPVIAGGADTQLALLGVGDITPDVWSIVAGTFWLTTVVWDEPLIDPKCRPRTLCHAVPGQWMTEGVGFLIGQQARWFRDGFCQEEIQRAEKENVDPYFLMEKLAEPVPPGANGIIGLFSDYHNSKFWKHAAPSLLNFDVYNPLQSGKPQSIRAIWESAAYTAYKNFLVLTELTGKSPNEITFCGGSSKGFLWPQIIADVFGVDVKVPVVKEATSFGCAMCVGIGAGLFKSPQDAVEKWVETERVFHPDAKAHEAYKKCFERWNEVYTEVMNIVNKGLLTPMWRAPGT